MSGLSMQLETEGTDDLQDGIEAWDTFTGMRFEEAFA
jgi:hypothetical protein